MLSSSFIIRTMHGLFNEEREREGLPPVYYKLASENPRNPANSGDAREEALLRMFNADRKLNEYSEVATINGQKYLIYAKPFLETNQACMRCHGDRKDAPDELQKIYSGLGGFNEETGRIRAIESVRIPINNDIAAAMVAATFSISAVVVFALLYTFNLRLKRELHQGTEALAVSEENYRQFASLTSDFVYICARKGDEPFRIRWIGGAFSAISGYSIEELYERGSWGSIIHTEDSDSREEAAAVMNPGDVKVITFRIVTRDKNVRWISDRFRCEKGGADDEFLLYGAARDVTDEKEAEELLQFTRVTINAVSDSIFWVAPDGSISDVNDAACRNLGFSREELLRMNVPDIDPDTTIESVRHEFIELRERKIIRFESRHRTKENRDFPVEIIASYVAHDAREFNCAIARDITERKQMEEAIRASNAFNSQIISSAHEGIVVHGTDIRYQVWNPFMEKLTGVKAFYAIGRSPLELFPFLEGIGMVDRLKRALAGENQEAFEFSFHSEGRENWVLNNCVPLKNDSGEIIGVISTIQEITERKKAEEERLNLEKQLLHAQKLESLGVLAGGIAHDFNNILTSIIGNTDLALLRMNPESPARDNLLQIEQAATRATDLAKQMLAYSGKGKFVIEPIDINRLVEEMTKMLEVSITKKCVLRFNFADALPAVEGDATQLRQIIMNLVINASEAIGDRSGIIAISTGCMQCDRKYLNAAWLNEQIPEGLYIWLEIADTGCGMDKDTLSKLFDPFFTTKFTGRGLGMAAVLGIVRGHRGAIKVYSEPRRGTTFKILLPAGEKPKELFNCTNERKNDWKGSGAVLIVDDEETVIGIGTQMLKELGFTPLAAMNGREALDIFERNQNEISCVILDLTMPGLDGEQTFRELRRIDPDVKVIMSSGYNEQEVTQRFVGKGLAGFIQKPYKLSTLRDIIRKIL